MLTKDFIKMLQEEDPEGTSHIRIDGRSVPTSVERKPGYWDGSYNYIDEKGNWVNSTMDSKIDIHFSEPEDIVDTVLDNYRYSKLSEESLWEKVKEKFKFELDWLHEEKNMKEKECFLSPIKSYLHDVLVSEKRRNEEYLKEAIENLNNGWKYLQEKEGYKYYGWKITNGVGIKQGVSASMTIPILDTEGIFHREDYNDKYYIWKKIDM